MKKIYTDTSTLPEKPEYRQLFPILKKRIEARSGAVCTETDQTADFVLKFALDPKLDLLDLTPIMSKESWNIR